MWKPQLCCILVEDGKENDELELVTQEVTQKTIVMIPVGFYLRTETESSLRNVVF
jgi:hypothetical protein